MAECLVNFLPADVPGAILPCPLLEDNTFEDLKRYVETRGFTVGKQESKVKLLKRISDLKSSGLDKFIVDPDGDVQYAIIEEHVRQKIPDISPPLLKSWTKDMAVPTDFSYSHLYEYLVKRTITILKVKDDVKEENSVDKELEFELPIAEKPLRKGYNFYGSGHVKDIRFCPSSSVTHVKASVMASMRNLVYVVSITIENSTSIILTAKCQCVAGAAGKCNHVAAVLFALVEYKEQEKKISCTDEPQQWNLPSRKSKQSTKPVNTGKHQIKKHTFGREVKRQRPLQEYASHNTVQDPTVDFKYLKENINDVPHKMAIEQLFMTSPSSSSQSQESAMDIDGENLKPEEIIMKELKVTVEDKIRIEKDTRGQSESLRWYRERKGRITASIAKSCCSKGNPAATVKNILTVGKPGRGPKSPHIKYGIENEENAVQKFSSQINAEGCHCSICKCGLFIEEETGVLAATPDRLATIDGEEVVVEVKCLSASRDLPPLAAVTAREKDGNFGFKLDKGQIVLKKKHKFFYQVQMQMALTNRLNSYVVIFTNDKFNVDIIKVKFDEQFWKETKEQLLSFHARHVVPALVRQRFR